MRWSSLFITLSLCAACGEGDADQRCGPSSATVVRVIDGDTVELDGGARLRYLLVDAPELSGASPECFAVEARDLNAQLVSGKAVTLEYDVECEDRFDRLLAYVSVGGRMVNRVLVERGYARVLVIAPNERYADELRALEDEAQRVSAGLWGACQ